MMVTTLILLNKIITRKFLVFWRKENNFSDTNIILALNIVTTTILPIFFVLHFFASFAPKY
jgi:hypothetical protein